MKAVKSTLVVLILLLSSCADQGERFRNLQKQFPHHNIVPGSQYKDHDFILIDTVGTAFGVDFCPWSTTKICNMHRLY
jgi:hypothetical protein